MKILGINDSRAENKDHRKYYVELYGYEIRKLIGGYHPTQAMIKGEEIFLDKIWDVVTRLNGSWRQTPNPNLASVEMYLRNLADQIAMSRTIIQAEIDEKEESKDSGQE